MGGNALSGEADAGAEGGAATWDETTRRGDPVLVSRTLTRERIKSMSEELGNIHALKTTT